MEIWLDTSNGKAVKKAAQLGVLGGVTTNPTIIADSKNDLQVVLKDLLHFQEGPVAVQVLADETRDMVQQGQTLFSFSNRIIIKVPVNKKGLEALHLLSRQGITTMATVVMTPTQALMAALAGADYIAPYVSQLEHVQKGDPCLVLETMMKVFQNYRLKTKILGASIKDAEQALRCAEVGIFGVTLKESIFDTLVEDHPKTTERVQKFNEDSKQIKAAFLQGSRAVMF